MSYESTKLKHFIDLGLAEPILHAVTAEGYSSPTPIQAKVIPTMMSGRDVLGIAQTGTGKTAAFVLPLLHRINNQTVRPEPKCCNTLILAPTRELAAQIADSVRTYGRSVRHTRCVIVGGVKPGPQIRTLAKGVDIIVATPGRLMDHMNSGALRLDQTTTVILDEADQMMDLGFLPAIRRILAKLPRQRQTLLLSATMPKQILGLARDFLTNPAEISVAPAAKPIDRIEQSVMLVDKAAKSRILIDLLGSDDVERAIVFTRTKRGADKVNRHLEKAGLSAAAIHGNKSQNQRVKTLAAFKSGSINILVATDIAARGIDVQDISHVINYELPNVPEAYVHRIGRTARAGKSGVAVSLCDNTERKLLRDIEKAIGNSVIAKSDLTTPGGATPEPRGQHVKPGSDQPVRNRRPARRRKPASAKNGQAQAQGNSHSSGDAQGQSRGNGQNQRNNQNHGQKSNGNGQKFRGKPKASRPRQRHQANGGGNAVAS